MPTETTILGTGIIGLSTAYHLSQSPTTLPSSITLIDPSPPHSSASGYAGGFLARDWSAGPTGPLASLSFDLHTSLAAAHNGRDNWGWSWTRCASLANPGSTAARGDDWLRTGASRAAAQKPADWQTGDGEGPGWLRRGGKRVEVIAEQGTTAQVDPRRLCAWLLRECERVGVKVVRGRALSVTRDTRGELGVVRVAVEGERAEEVDLPCTRLVITAGAWTPRVFESLFPEATVKLKVKPLAGHSLVLKSPRWAKEHEDAMGCHAVFATDESGFSPEIFSRLGEEIYVAGLNDSSLPLPDAATDAKPDPTEIDKLRQVARRMMGLESGEDDLQVLREGLCFRPVNESGPPIVSRVPDDKLGGGMSTRGGGDGGVFVSAGHGPWGISQSLGTGKVLAELIEGQQPSVDISGLGL